jgi:aminopeptidase N
MRIPAGLCLASLVSAAALLPALALAEAPPAGRTVLPDNVVPIHYDIAFQPDSKGMTFTASAAIRVKVRVPTDTIVLNAADLVVDRAALSGSAAAPGVSYDDKVQTATFSFPAKLEPGEHVLSLDYHGRILQQAYGLFALDYATPAGTQRCLFTQFENADARRFVPCWDEPALKATFTLTATVPSGLMPISNMPVSATDALPGGLVRVHFAETPKMSCYLLFFGLGDLERIHRDVDGTDVGVIVKRGDAASGQYALDTAVNLLRYYNDYFGVPYPLPKLDLIAAPGSSTFFSAMENWGAIFYFERVLLFDPRISTESDKHRIHSVIAHEMSHQWFGDLVTMQWWDDLWLNEGFASWMQEKATEHFHPEWNVWLRELGDKNAVMQTDERDGTHPIITPIGDVLQANSAFDRITYTKGQAVIRMLEAYVGEANFRAGVRQYMKDHAYGNTVTEDLWKEIDAVSDRKLTQIAHDFTLHSGVPMITAAPSGTGLSLSQERFALDASGSPGGAWQVPVIVLPGGGGGTPGRAVVAASGPTQLADAPSGSIVNGGQTGYFRVLYTGKAFSAAADRLASLPPSDQLGLMDDVEALGDAGREPMGDFLALASRLPVNANPVIWMMVSDRLEWLDTEHEGLESQAAFRGFARGLLGSKFQGVGFDAVPGEPDNTAILRSSLLSSLGSLGDGAVLAEARRRFAVYLKDPSSLSGAARESVLTIVATNADPATWDQLHALALAATSTLDKQRFPYFLGLSRDESVAKKSLQLAMTDEVPITFRPQLFRAVAVYHPELAFDFTVAHWDELGRMIEDPNRRSAMILALLGTASETAVLGRLDSFAAAHVSPSLEKDVRRTASLVRDNARIRTERLPEADHWVAGQAEVKSP